MAKDNGSDKSSTSLLGKEHTFQASEEIGEVLIKRFAAAMGDHNPLYWDRQYAQKSPYGDIIAPPTLIFELTYDVGGSIDSEKGLYQGLEAWAGFPTRLERAGNEYEIFQPAHPDDVITVKRKIVDVTERQGKTGKWTFITTEITYTNQESELLGIDKETLACRYQ